MEEVRTTIWVGKIEQVPVFLNIEQELIEINKLTLPMNAIKMQYQLKDESNKIVTVCNDCINNGYSSCFSYESQEIKSSKNPKHYKLEAKITIRCNGKDKHVPSKEEFSVEIIYNKN